MSGAREEILGRIRNAHAAAPPDSPAYSDLERDYRTTSDLDAAALVERLVDRLVDYRAAVRSSSLDDLPATFAAALAERGAGRVVVPAGLDPDWLSGVSATLVSDDAAAQRRRAGRVGCGADRLRGRRRRDRHPDSRRGARSRPSGR